jgi:protocatechuate 3,4-dioxygenase beta subunit
VGRLVGRVALHVAGQEPRPLPDVAVEVLGVLADGKALRREATSDVEGRFSLDDVPAHAGYAVVARLPPWKEIVRRGVVVPAGGVADLGVLAFGLPTSLEGSVVDAAGRPLAGAVVAVLADAPRKDVLDVQAGLLELQGTVDPLALADADGDGRFELKDLPPGRYVLRVSAPGYAAAFRDGVRVTVDERSPAVRVVLDGGAGWTGRVVDERGDGVGGARVIAVALPGGEIARLDRVETRSGADGAYRLDTLVSGMRYFVEAWADGYSPTGRFLVPDGVADLDLVVVTAGRIEGFVTDASDGSGIADALVTALAGKINSLSPVSARTDARGFYALPAVSPGPVFLFAARAPGHAPESLDAKALAGRVVVAGETLRLDLPLLRGGRVRGRVASTAGRPLPYATVALLDPARRWQGEQAVLTDVRGEYRVEDLRPATYEVRVVAPGFAPPPGDDPSAWRVAVPEGSGEVVKDLVLAPGGELSGVVRDPDGAPVAGARVSLLAPGVHDLAAVADAAGAWRLAGVPPGTDVVVVAEHDDWTRAVSQPLRLAAGEAKVLEIVLRAGATLPGRAVDARGRGVEGARVRWGRVAPGQEGRVSDAYRADELLGTRVLRTDADGRFALVRLEGGRHVVKVEADGYADWFRSDVHVGEDGLQPALTATLEGAHTIRGRVSDARTGAPIAECWVYARAEDAVDAAPDPGRVKPLVSAQTGADGAFLLQAVPPGRYEVVCWLALGYVAYVQDAKSPAVRRLGIEAGARAVDFRLEPEAPPR